MNLQEFRQSYTQGRLRRHDLQANPIAQFEQWLNEMLASGLAEPTAMSVATVNDIGEPSQRYVLLKRVDEEGFVFFTDMRSQKGKEIAVNAKVSLLFPWHAFERQVRVKGQACELPRADVDAYFNSRPLGSQLAAYTSEQSQVIDSRSNLEKQYQANQQELGDSIPLPDRWGGYRVTPFEIEFWQGGEHRLHDRFRYRFTDQDQWIIERLQP